MNRQEAVTASPTGEGLSRRHFLAASSGAVGLAAATGLPSFTARAATLVGQPLPPWADPTVLFDDDASSLAAAGWAPRAAAAGAYVVDAVGSAANPHDLPLPTVPAGQYLLYADEVSQPATNYAVMTRPIAIGAGAWQVDLRMRIDDIPEVYENAYTRGLMLIVNAGGQRFTFALVNRDKLHIGYGTSVNSHVRPVPVPYDSAFHDWTFRYDGIDTTMVALDGVLVAVLRDVNVSQPKNAEGLTLNALAVNWKSGAVQVLIDHVRVSVRRTTTALGPGTSLTDAGWLVDPAVVDTYLTDASHSTGTVTGMPAVTSGECLLVAKDVVTGRHAADLGTGAWTWRFFAAGTALPATDTFGAGGVVLRVDAGGRRLELSMVADRIGLRRVDGSWITAEIAGATDGKFHRWTIARDGRGRHLVERDGRIVLVTDAQVTTPTTADDGVAIIGDGRGATDSVTMKFSGFVLGRDTSTAFHQPSIDAVSVVGDSDASTLRVVIGVAAADPVDLVAGALRLTAVLVRNDDSSSSPIATGDQAIRSRYEVVTLPAGGSAADLRLELTLRRGAEVVATATQRWLAPSTVTMLAPGSAAAPAAGAAAVFDQVDHCRTTDDIPALDAGWDIGTYSADGVELAGLFLDSSDTAQPIAVPVTIDGPCTVRVGYLSGTEALEVTVGGTTRRIDLPGTPAYDPDSGFGPRVVGEVEVFTGDGAGNTVVISPVAGKQLRLVHLRVTGLSTEEQELAGRPVEGAAGRRAMYNNDGYSDFFEGRYDSVAGLQKNAVDVYQDSDVGAMTWQNGTTFLLTYDSQWAGRPYASLTPEQRALMEKRTGDVVAMDAILAMVDNGLVPLELVTARAGQIGIDAYAGLRMDTFYPMTTAPWLNGNLWDEYQDSRLTTYAGSRSATRMTYTSTKFATYIRNVLVELAAFSGVAGLDLDFSRYPDVVGWEPATMAAYQAAYGIDPRKEVTPDGSLRWQHFRADLVTEVFRQLRAAVPDTTVIVRVPQSNSLAYGLDVATWVSEGLIDALVPTNISHEQFWSNVDEFTALVDGTPVKLYGGVTHTLAGGDLTKEEQELAERGYATTVVRTSMSSEMYVERASEFYRAGYDGVYVFNNWRARASLGLIGDKVATEQWRTFVLPATWTHLGVSAERVTAGTPGDLVTLLGDLRSADDLSIGMYERFRATIDQVSRAASSNRTELATTTLHRMITQIREALAEGNLTTTVATVLIAATSRVAAAL